MNDSLYRVKEIFLTVQGEGAQLGMPAVFVRFTGCNLACFFCDTDFKGGSKLTAADIVQQCCDARGHAAVHNVVLTGGEPALQVDSALVSYFHAHGWRCSIETNGTLPLPDGIDWVTCSPKDKYEGSKGKVVLRYCDELKYVVQHGDTIPQPPEGMHYRHKFLSPMTDPLKGFQCPSTCLNSREAISLAQHHAGWRVTLQSHKIFGVR